MPILEGGLFPESSKNRKHIGWDLLLWLTGGHILCMICWVAKDLLPLPE